MSALILDGRKVRDLRMLELKTLISSFSHAPTLAIVQVGNRADSTSYIKAKKAFAEKIGVKIKHIHLSDSASLDEITKSIKKLNSDISVTGIIVQLPLPVGIDKDQVINTIDPTKDADGLTLASFEERTKKKIWPATARGVRELLKYYKISLSGKKVVVIGRSALVGKPIAEMCADEGANVTVCHSKTSDLISATKVADIIIVAVGKAKLITKDHVKVGQVVIDVGITKNGEEGIVGDVDFDAVKDIVGAISPVPGGVGPMTVLSLFENLVDLMYKQG